MWTSDGGGGKTWWLDNERILFPSNEKLVPGGGPTKMMVWNLFTGRVEPSPLTSVICAREGQVFFARRDNATNRVTYYRGPLENPREYPPHGPDMRFDERFDCGWAPKNTRANVPYRVNLKGENYLEVRKADPEQGVWPRETFGKQHFKQANSCFDKTTFGGPILQTVFYIHRAGEKGFELPFQLGGWNGYDLEYVEWRKAYLVKPDQYYVDKQLRLWWLERNGNIQEEPLPDKLPFPSAGGIDFHPVKKGIFVSYNGGSLSDSDGGYLIREGKVERVIKHMVHKLAVSPDGCRVVFEHARNTNEYYSQKMPYRTLKIIDFCQGGTKR